jgi:hypothetical protein
MGVLMSFNGSENGKEICRIKEYEFAKGNTPTANPLRTVIIKNNTTYGTVSAIPAKARAGESVKIILKPREGFQCKEVVVKTAKGKKQLKVNPNNESLYASRSFNFEMPEDDVNVDVMIVSEK